MKYILVITLLVLPVFNSNAECLYDAKRKVEIRNCSFSSDGESFECNGKSYIIDNKNYFKINCSKTNLLDVDNHMRYSINPEKLKEAESNDKK